MKNASIPSSEITPESEYINRRHFMKKSVLSLAGFSLLSACSKKIIESPSIEVTPISSGITDELGDPVTEYADVISYNNFYEFSFAKEQVAELAENFTTSPWTITVGGLVNNPKTFDIDDIRKLFDVEERIYRMRCVEAWSMVIPWMGFTLNQLLKLVEPTSDAKYVRFESLYDPSQMPDQNDPFFSWPYVEGLRLDEANHDLTLISTGLYGNDLLPQNGAPLRLVVPWKYGFKSIKSIVRIDLVSEKPISLWMESSPREYGFYANVNPEVDHPRWSQGTERRIGEAARRSTQLFNGYGDDVSGLYQGMDLRGNF
jgi:methionine sulfoxide reductase catalytic subunit